MKKIPLNNLIPSFLQACSIGDSLVSNNLCEEIRLNKKTCEKYIKTKQRGFIAALQNDKIETALSLYEKNIELIPISDALIIANRKNNKTMFAKILDKFGKINLPQELIYSIIANNNIDFLKSVFIKKEFTNLTIYSSDFNDAIISCSSMLKLDMLKLLIESKDFKKQTSINKKQTLDTALFNLNSRQNESMIEYLVVEYGYVPTDMFLNSLMKNHEQNQFLISLINRKKTFNKITSELNDNLILENKTSKNKV